MVHAIRRQDVGGGEDGRRLGQAGWGRKVAGRGGRRSRVPWPLFFGGSGGGGELGVTGVVRIGGGGGLGLLICGEEVANVWEE